MDIFPVEPRSETEADSFPLLMERRVNHSDNKHIIDISRSNDASSSLSHNDHPPGGGPPQHEDRRSSSSPSPTYQTSLSSSNRVDSSNSSFIRRAEGHPHQRRSPLNSKLWISIELVVTLGQIIAAVVVLSLSRHENPQAPLFAWVVGYASGCLATLPILYWRYRYHNRGAEQDTARLHHGLSQSNPSSEPSSYTAISVTHTSEHENEQTTILASTDSQMTRSFGTRLSGQVDHLKMALDFFFAVWFVVGNVWIFGGHTPSDAPTLYRLCIVFLTFSCIGYAMPLILCATICCCLPCMTSILGFQEDLSHTRGATLESINALPMYKFKLKKNGVNKDTNSQACEGGVVAEGTEKERVISGEDAVCCICLAKYADNDDLRELPCSHLFHMVCVDKWLKIHASCPLCKIEVGENGRTLSSTPDSNEHHRERVGNGLSGSAYVVYGSTMF